MTLNCPLCNGPLCSSVKANHTGNDMAEWCARDCGYRVEWHSEYAHIARRRLAQNDFEPAESELEVGESAATRSSS